MSRTPRAQRGAIAVIVGLTLSMLLAVAGIVIDTGNMLLTKTRLQTLADAAALACANANLRTPSSCTSATGGTSALIQAINPYGYAVALEAPTACPATAQSGCVRAVASSTLSTFFLRIIGRASVDVSAVARAGSATGSPCILALGTGSDARRGLSVSLGTTIDAPGCAVQSNADWSALGTGTRVNAGQIDYVNAFRCDGTCAPGSEQVGTRSDPFASLTPPTFPSYRCTNPNCNSCSGRSCTFQPGTYTSGLLVSAGADAVFLPGNYNIQSQRLIISSSAVRGSGVTFYLSQGSTLSISGDRAVNLSAPENGMLFWQAADTIGDSTIAGGSTTTLNGSIYAPRARVMVSAGTDGMTLGTIAAGQISISGGSNINLATTVPGAVVRLRPVLVE